MLMWRIDERLAVKRSVVGAAEMLHVESIGADEIPGRIDCELEAPRRQQVRLVCSLE